MAQYVNIYCILTVLVFLLKLSFFYFRFFIYLQVMAADAFSAFEEVGLENREAIREVGMRYVFNNIASCPVWSNNPSANVIFYMHFHIRLRFIVCNDATTQYYNTVTQAQLLCCHCFFMISLHYLRSWFLFHGFGCPYHSF